MTDTAGAPDAALVEAALIEEGAKKSALLWLTVRGGPPRPVWHVWLDGAAWLVTGRRADGVEQYVEGLTGVDRVVVDVRGKDKGGRLPGWTARVAVVPPGADGYDAGVLALHGARLNAPDGEAQPERWARECDVVRLTPSGPVLATTTDGGHAVPIGSPAVTRGATPLDLSIGRRRRRRG